MAGDRATGSPPSAIRSANDSLSDTSAFVSSLTQDMSHSPSISSLPTSTPSTPRRVIIYTLLNRVYVSAQPDFENV